MSDEPVARNVGELRQLIEGLPDEARLLPDWEPGQAPGDDSEPGVWVGGLRVRRYTNGEPYLSVGVALWYGEDPQEAESGV